MHALIHSLLLWYFGVLNSAGMFGVAVLMAMESTIFPVPSELVVPPAAFLLGYHEGQILFMQVILVVVAGTVGSYLGSAATYWVCRVVGRPIIVRYGKYFLIPEKKLLMAEDWVRRYAAGGIFFARLLPVIRHLISIPAGLTRMPFGSFSLMTTVGSGLWCSVLAAFGIVMARDMGIVMRTMEYNDEAKAAFFKLTVAIIVLVGIMGVLYLLVVKRKGSSGSSPIAPAVEAPKDTPVA